MFGVVRMCLALAVAISIAAGHAHADSVAAAEANGTVTTTSTHPPGEVTANASGDTANGAVGRRPSALHMDDAAIERRLEPVSGKRRALAIGLAIVPGVVVHGLGAWTVREKHTAKVIASGEAIGIGVAALSGLLVGGSGGNKYTVVPGVPLVVAGAGLFLQSWFTDIYVAAGGNWIAERPRATSPWSVEVGTSWLHDAYRERALLRAGGRLELDALVPSSVGSSSADAVLARIDVGATALVDAGGDALLGDGDVRVRILGARASGEQVDDNSRLGVRIGARYHRDDGDRTTQWTPELAIEGRLDLDRIDRMFRGSFAELGAGIGLVHVAYGDDIASEWSSELLAHFAWGAYLGKRGEAQLYYEHARDGLVGGIAAWRASGFVGSVGGAIDLRVHGPWAVRAQLDIGNAWLTTLAIGYRGGPR